MNIRRNVVERTYRAVISYADGSQTSFTVSAESEAAARLKAEAKAREDLCAFGVPASIQITEVPE